MVDTYKPKSEIVLLGGVFPIHINAKKPEGIFKIGAYGVYDI